MDVVIHLKNSRKQPLSDLNGTFVKILSSGISSAKQTANSTADGNGCDGDKRNGNLRESVSGMAGPLGIILHLATPV